MEYSLIAPWVVPLQELFETDLLGKSGDQKVQPAQLYIIDMLSMELLDVLLGAYELALEEDAVVRALLHLFPKARLYDLSNTLIFDPTYLDFFDLLVKDEHDLLISEQLGYIGREQR